MTILSKITKVASSVASVPKPPLSILRPFMAVAVDNPIGLAVAGTAVGVVGAVEIYKHKDQIESALGKIGGSIKTTVSSVSTSSLEKVGGTSSSEIVSSTESMMLPILLLGGGLVVVFILMRK
jgi:hypothetical protein